MALEEKKIDNYYLITFMNNREIFLKTDLFLKTQDMLKDLDDSVFGSNFIPMKQINTERERNPVNFSRLAIFSVEKVNASMIGNSTKLWEIVK